MKDVDATGTSAKTDNTGPYSRNFEQVLTDNRVFPAFYQFPDGRVAEAPKNIDQIRERMKQRRSSLSRSRYKAEEFNKFQILLANAKTEEQVTKSVIPIIEGSSGDTKFVCGDIKFGNLQSLVGSNGNYTLAPGNPDLYDGARPEQLDRRIRDRLANMIIPSTQDNLPMAPNFFLHVKGPNGTEAVAMRQAVYDGALGARGQHHLRAYGTNEVGIDSNNAHTITSVFSNSVLSMYTVYTTRTSNSPSGRQVYYTHLIESWAIAGSMKSFRKGAAAFRNLRDWAKEQRDEAIELANSRVVVDQIGGEEDLTEGEESLAEDGESMAEDEENLPEDRERLTESEEDITEGEEYMTESEEDTAEGEK